MRVLHLISSSGYFGADNMLIALAGGAAGSAVSPVVGVFRNVHNPHLEIGEAARSHDIPVEVFPCSGKVDIGTVLRIRRFLIRGEIDLLHTHGYKSNLYGLAASAGMRIGRISTCHNWLGDDRKMRSYARLDKFFLKRFDRVVAVSEAIRDELVSAGIPLDRIVTIHNGIDLKRFQYRSETGTTRGTFGIREDFKVVGAVGRLSREKGHTYLLQAARDARLEGEKLVFLVVGDGPLRARLEEQACGRGKRSPQIVFAGIRSDMERLYGLMDVFVLPSLTEGLPMALLEAIAAKRPVVATRVGGVPRVIEDGVSGRLVAPGDGGALAEAIGGILVDPEGARRMAEKAYETVRSNFSAAAMVQRYLDVYEELVPPFRGRRGRSEKGSAFAKVKNG